LAGPDSKRGAIDLNQEQTDTEHWAADPVDVWQVVIGAAGGSARHPNKVRKGDWCIVVLQWGVSFLGVKLRLSPVGAGNAPARGADHPKIKKPKSKRISKPGWRLVMFAPWWIFSVILHLRVGRFAWELHKKTQQGGAYPPPFPVAPSSSKLWVGELRYNLSPVKESIPIITLCFSKRGTSKRSNPAAARGVNTHQRSHDHVTIARDCLGRNIVAIIT